MFLKSFVKRKRPLSKNKQLLLEKTLPKFQIIFEAFPMLVKKYDIINLEIGFGKGEFLSTLALGKAKNDLNIGCEPYAEGIASLLQKITQHDIKNIMIWPDDARLLLSKITNHSINNIYILFPDPWPKRKQQKRRLINAQFIKLIVKKLKSGGVIFIATDHHDYANWIFAHFEQNKNFLCKDISNVSMELFEDCFTQYHKKNIEGKKIKVFKFILHEYLTQSCHTLVDCHVAKAPRNCMCYIIR